MQIVLTVEHVKNSQTSVHTITQEKLQVFSLDHKLQLDEANQLQFLAVCKNY
jgi:hypothetical protein